MQVTFKSNSSKSNAKRFLTNTAKVEASMVDAYLTQVDGAWGCYLDTKGNPVTLAAMAPKAKPAAATKPSARQELAEARSRVNAANAAAKAKPAPAPAEEEVAAPVALVFGGALLGQLTGGTVPDHLKSNKTPDMGDGKTGVRIQKDRPEQNGVRRMSPGTVGDRLWALFDAVGESVTLKQAREMGEANGMSPTSAGLALYQWRRFNGYGKKVGGNK